MGQLSTTVVAIHTFTMRSFVALFACAAAASASVVVPGYTGYAATGYAGYPGYNGFAVYAAAPAVYAQPAGVYAGLYDPSVAYSQLSPAAPLVAAHGYAAAPAYAAAAYPA